MLHREALREDDRGRWEGMPVTTLGRTLVDRASRGTPTYLLRQAVEAALRDGLVGDGIADEVDALVEARGE